MKKRIVAVIPARMAASRFPGKPLARISGLPMIEHVRRRTKLCGILDDVVVATCDQVIIDAVKSFGGKAVMTKDTHLRCTDRVEEAAAHIEADIVVIVQGDEPLFDGSIIDKLVQPLLADPKLVCTNLLTPITEPQDILDVDIVKALMDVHSHVLYFSRAPVPHVRVNSPCPVYRQTGLSAFTKDFLIKFSHLPPTPLEIVESVDFLRILEHRYPIYGVVHPGRSVGVDRPDDVAIVEDVLKNDPVQKKIFEQIVTR